jgi:hypothetical protein
LFCYDVKIVVNQVGGWGAILFRGKF